MAHRHGSATLSALSIALIFLAQLSHCSPHVVQITGQVVADVDLPEWAPVSIEPPRQTHEVVVGQNNQAAFNPPLVDANLGDVVHFTFASGNHTVTETTFAHPCQQESIFDTGFARAGSTDGCKDLSVLVDSSNPRWFFCRQEVPYAHCSSGMVFAINPGKLWNDFLVGADNASFSTTSSFSLTAEPVSFVSSSSSFPVTSTTPGLEPNTLSSSSEPQFHDIVSSIETHLLLSTIESPTMTSPSKMIPSWSTGSPADMASHGFHSILSALESRLMPNDSPSTDESTLQNETSLLTSTSTITLQTSYSTLTFAPTYSLDIITTSVTS